MITFLAIFKILQNKNVLDTIFVNLSIHKTFPGVIRGPDGLSRFDVYWMQTQKQTDKQSICIDKGKYA